MPRIKEGESEIDFFHRERNTAGALLREGSEKRERKEECFQRGNNGLLTLLSLFVCSLRLFPSSRKFGFVLLPNGLPFGKMKRGTFRAELISANYGDEVHADLFAADVLCCVVNYNTDWAER